MATSTKRKASTLAEQIALSRVPNSPDEFHSDFPPGWMGNTAQIAYGGCTLAIGVHAACLTVDSKYHLYSSNGNYLGPAQTDRKLHCRVKRLRDTRTFATRFVEVSQEVGDKGERRVCLTMLADFQVPEPADVLQYSAPPASGLVVFRSGAESCMTREKIREAMVREGKVSAKVAKMHEKTFELGSRMFDNRPVPGSVAHQILMGFAKNLPTTQDAVPLTEKTSGEWVRARMPVSTQAEHLAGLAMHIDGAISFIPLLHKGGMFLDDVGACSSLDFGLRVFSNQVDINSWNFKEWKTVYGGNGRTYSEARVWDERGNLIASMTQINILRPKPAEKAAL